jgi:hypothetical protein
MKFIDRNCENIESSEENGCDIESRKKNEYGMD